MYREFGPGIMWGNYQGCRMGNLEKHPYNHSVGIVGASLGIMSFQKVPDDNRKLQDHLALHSTSNAARA